MKLDKLRDNIKKVIIGNELTIDLIITTMLSGGHILLEDTPGTGKTTLAKTLAKSISCDFSRIQFTPDLLPSDITGMNIYDKKEDNFKFIEGPVMTNILLADEINRATPRTQSALLEAMQEKQVTVDGTTRILNDPFMVIATQNPIETSGTFPLPEAQLDRFTMQLSMGFPSEDDEFLMLTRFGERNPLDEIEAVLTTEEIIALRKEASEVKIHKDLVKYIVSIVQATRNNSQIFIGASPRSSLSLQEVAKAHALICGRNFVLPEDIKELAPYVLSHRITYQCASTYTERINIVKNIISEIIVPSEDFSN